MVKLSVIETEKPKESLIIGKGTKDFAYRFRPYSRWPQGSQFKVFTTIAETQISVEECHVNDEGEVIFRVNGDIKDAKAFIKDWIEREGWKVENLDLENGNMSEVEIQEAFKTALSLSGIKNIAYELTESSEEVSGGSMALKNGVIFVHPRNLRTMYFEEKQAPELSFSQFITHKFLHEIGHFIIPLSKIPFELGFSREYLWEKECERYAQHFLPSKTLLARTLLWYAITDRDFQDASKYQQEKESLATRRWRLRVKAEGLVKEIREEKAKHGSV